MRICSPQLGLAPTSILGGEVFDREILLGLAKHGIKVEIILPKNKKHDKNLKNWNVTYLPFSHFPAILGNVLFIPYIFNIYKSRKFDILRLHQPQFLALCALTIKMFHPEVKLVVTYHQFRETGFWFLSKWINNFWDHIICDSQSVKNRLIKKYSVPSRKITVVHNGVPPYLSPTIKDSSLAKNLALDRKIVLLFMGLFDARKNPLFLIDVLIKLKSDLVIIFWGKGPQEAQIKKKAGDLGLEDKIKIQKPLFGKEKNKIHNLADIFVHPSVDEGFALAPLESMACAKPVVMTDGYSAREAVEDGLNGYLANYNDTKDWSDKLNRLIESPKLREKMGRASLKKVKDEFQWEMAVRRHLEVFKQLQQ